MTTEKDKINEDDSLEALQKVLGIGDICGIECPYCKRDIDLEEEIKKVKKSQKQKIIEEIEKMDFEFLYKSQVEDVKKELLKTLGEKEQ